MADNRATLEAVIDPGALQGLPVTISMTMTFCDWQRLVSQLEQVKTDWPGYRIRDLVERVLGELKKREHHAIDI